MYKLTLFNLFFGSLLSIINVSFASEVKYLKKSNWRHLDGEIILLNKDVQKLHEETDLDLMEYSKSRNNDLVDPNDKRKIAEKYLRKLENQMKDWKKPHSPFNVRGSEEDDEISEVHSTYVGPQPCEKISQDFDSASLKMFDDSYLEDSGVISKVKDADAHIKVYITRWVNKLLHKVDNPFADVHVYFHLDQTVFQGLKSISKSSNIPELDAMICSAIDNATVSTSSYFVFNYDINNFVFVVYFLGFVFLLCVSYYLYQIFLNRLGAIVLIAILVGSIFWHWMHLYERKKAEKHSILRSFDTPIHCQKYNYGVSEMPYVIMQKIFASSDECEKFYEALMVDAFWEVSISVAISETITAIIFQPLNMISLNINRFIKQLFSGLTIFQSLFVIIMSMFIILILGKYKFRLPYLMASIEPAFGYMSRIEEIHERPHNREPSFFRNFRNYLGFLQKPALCDAECQTDDALSITSKGENNSEIEQSTEKND